MSNHSAETVEGSRMARLIRRLALPIVLVWVAIAVRPTL